LFSRSSLQESPPSTLRPTACSAELLQPQASASPWSCNASPPPAFRSGPASAQRGALEALDGTQSKWGEVVTSYPSMHLSSAASVSPDWSLEASALHQQPEPKTKGSGHSAAAAASSPTTEFWRRHKEFAMARAAAAAAPTSHGVGQAGAGTANLQESTWAARRQSLGDNKSQTQAGGSGPQAPMPGEPPTPLQRLPARHSSALPSPSVRELLAPLAASTGRPASPRHCGAEVCLSQILEALNQRAQEQSRQIALLRAEIAARGKA